MKINRKSILGITILAVCFIVFCLSSSICLGCSRTTSSSAVLSVPNVSRLTNLKDVKQENSWLNPSLTTINGGEYSADNPYKIASADDLISMSALVNKRGGTWRTAHYKMVNHINLAGYNWEPIGNEASDDLEFDNNKQYYSFSGVFDGNGFSIYGLTIVDTESSQDQCAGLFGVITGNSTNLARISRLGLKDTIILTSRNCVGAFAGKIDAVSEINAEWKGYLGDNADEGLHPRVYSQVNNVAQCAIEDCYNVGFVQGGAYVGGFVGVLRNGVIFNSYCYGMEIIEGLNDVYDVCSVLDVDWNNSNQIDFAVGGLVGWLGFNSNTTALLSNTITVMRVGWLSDEDCVTNLGFVVGSAANEQLSSQKVKSYRTNFYASDIDYRTFNTGIGVGESITSLNLSGVHTKDFNKAFNLNSYNYDDTPAILTMVPTQSVWLNSNSSNINHTVWIQGGWYNNGLPVLWNVPQLIKISFKAVVNNEDVTDKFDNQFGDVLLKFGYDSQDGAFEFFDDLTNSYIFQQGKANSDAFNMSAGVEFEGKNSIAFLYNDSDNADNTGKWHYEFRKDSATLLLESLEQAEYARPGITNFSKTVGYACHDSVIVCGLKYKEYTVDLESFNCVENDALIETGEQSYTSVNANNPATYNNEKIALSFVLNPGYEITHFTIFGAPADEYFEKTSMGYNLKFHEYLHSDLYDKTTSYTQLEITAISELKSASVSILRDCPDENYLDVVYADLEGTPSALTTTPISLHYGTILHLKAIVHEGYPQFEFYEWGVTQNGESIVADGAGLLEFDFTIGNYDEIVITAKACKHQIMVRSRIDSYAGGTVLIDGNEVTNQSFDFDQSVVINVIPHEGYNYKKLRLFKDDQTQSVELTQGGLDCWAEFENTQDYSATINLLTLAQTYGYEFGLTFDLDFGIETYDIEFKLNYLDVDDNLVKSTSKTIQSASSPNFNSEQDILPNNVVIDNVNADLEHSLSLQSAPSGNNAYDTTVMFVIDYTNLLGYEVNSLQVMANNTLVNVTSAEDLSSFSFVITADSFITLNLKEKIYSLNIEGLESIDSSEDAESAMDKAKKIDSAFIKIKYGENLYPLGKTLSFTQLSDDSTFVVVQIPSAFEFANYITLNNEIYEGTYTYDNSILTIPVRVVNNNDFEFSFRYAQKKILVSVSIEGIDDYSVLDLSNGFTFSEGANPMIKLNYSSNVQIGCKSIFPEEFENYKFGYWKVNGIKASTDYTIDLQNLVLDTLVTAVIEPVKYNVRVEIGEIFEDSQRFNYSFGAGKVNHAEQVAFNESILLKAEETFGYGFAGWYKKVGDGDNESYQLLSTSPIYRMKNIQQDSEITVENDGLVATVYAAFNKLYKLVVEVCQGKAGNVDVVESMVSPKSGADYYFSNSAITLTAQAQPHWAFDYWKIDGKIIDNSDTQIVILDSNKIVQANFKPIYSLNVTPNNERYGQVSKEFIDDNPNSVRLEAGAESNCEFIGWVVDGIMVSTNEVFVLNLNGDVNIEAVFKKNFNWNTIIILFGCVLFVVIIIALVAYYIQRKEEEPMKVRVLLDGSDDKAVLQKKTKRNVYRDIIEPVPMRKVTRTNIAPIPVRKINVAPMKHNGVVVGRKNSAKDDK